MKYPADLQPGVKMDEYQFIEFFWMNSPEDRIKIARRALQAMDEAERCWMHDHQGMNYVARRNWEHVIQLLNENQRLRYAWRSARSRARRLNRLLDSRANCVVE